jgi:hypothetical protein
MLAEDIGRIEDTIKVVHLNELGSNGLSNTMKGQCIVALMQLHMRDSQAVHDCFVVTKNVALAVSERNAKVMQGGMEVDNLINVSAGHNKFRTISSCLNHSLFLGVPIKGCLAC